MSSSIRPSQLFRINPITEITTDPRKALVTLGEATTRLQIRNEQLAKHNQRDLGSVERLRSATSRLTEATNRLERKVR